MHLQTAATSPLAETSRSVHSTSKLRFPVSDLTRSPKSRLACVGVTSNARRLASPRAAACSERSCRCGRPRRRSSSSTLARSAWISSSCIELPPIDATIGALGQVHITRHPGCPQGAGPVAHCGHCERCRAWRLTAIGGKEATSRPYRTQLDRCHTRGGARGDLRANAAVNDLEARRARAKAEAYRQDLYS